MVDKYLDEFMPALELREYLKMACITDSQIVDMILGSCGSCEETNLFFHYMKTHVIESMDYQNVLEFVLEFKRWKEEYTVDKDFENRYILAYKGKCFCIKGLYVYEVNNSFCVLSRFIWKTQY